MSKQTWVDLAYLVAAICFVLALKGLSSPKSAKSSMAASSSPKRPMAAAASARTSGEGSWIRGAWPRSAPATASPD